jgi:hypothetical protein
MLGDGLRKRLEELNPRQPMIQQRLRWISQGATIRAIEEAVEHTPPNGEEKERGVGMITGELAQHWADDSQVELMDSGGEYRTVLANNVQYASYVNDGHRMDKHFVPGLMVNPESGLLERVDPSMGGITVGTKTTYVPGLYMKEKAVDKYREVAEAELPKLAREVFQ